MIQNKKKNGLIGYPLEHSFSYRYFTEKFKNEEIKNTEYKNFPIENIEDFPALIKQNKNLLGLSVTSPYKESVKKYIDKLDESAIDAGAVNTIKIERTRNSTFLTGYNTDIYGFTNSLKSLLNPEIKSAIIIGTGGAAKASAYALQKLEIKSIHVSRKNTDSNKNLLNYNDLSSEIIGNNLLIINATPIGMFPDTENFPNIKYEHISKNHILFDLIYNPSETIFLKKGKLQGAKTLNGLKMLELQAEKAWEYFTQ